MADRPIYEPGVRYAPVDGAPDDEWRDVPSTLSNEALDCVDPDVTERVLLFDKEELRRLWRDHGSKFDYHRAEIDDAYIAHYMATMLSVRCDDEFSRAYHELGCRVIPRMLATRDAPRDPPFHVQMVWPDGKGPEDPSAPSSWARYDAGMTNAQERAVVRLVLLTNMPATNKLFVDHGHGSYISQRLGNAPKFIEIVDFMTEMIMLDPPFSTQLMDAYQEMVVQSQMLNAAVDEIQERKCNRFDEVVREFSDISSARNRYLRMFPPHVDCVTQLVYDEREDALRAYERAADRLRALDVDVPAKYIDSLRAKQVK